VTGDKKKILKLVEKNKGDSDLYNMLKDGGSRRKEQNG
jgi:hypothetical protein